MGYFELKLKDEPSRYGGNYKLIPIEDIVDIEQTQIREAYDESAISEFERLYRESYQRKEHKDFNHIGSGIGQDKNTACFLSELPYITVVESPNQKEKYWIVDGHHRYQAAVRAGEKKITVESLTDILKQDGNFEVKDLSDLHFLQGRENDEHVANRTNETKRRQVEAVLAKRPQWTDKEIAYYCNVSRPLVATVRESLENNGNIQTKQTAMEKAQDAIADPENEGKSNVQIAKEIGVNEKTVREARKNAELQNSEGEEEYPQSEDVNLNRVSANAQSWLDNNGFDSYDEDDEFYEPQERPTLNKVTEDSKRVKPEIEKTKELEIKDVIRLSNKNNMRAIVQDVLTYLGERAETFRILLNDELDS